MRGEDEEIRATKCLRPGFTLLELLTVMAILTVLLGLSYGIYRKLSVSYQLPATTSYVTSVLRAARRYSRTSGLESRVLVEPAASTVTALGYELVASWHFEDFGSGAEVPIEPDTEVRGALKERGKVVGEVYAVRGKVGSALRFANDGAAVVAPFRPRYHSPRGFSLEAWVFFEGPPLSAADIKAAAKLARRRGSWVDPRSEVLYAVISLRDGYEIGVEGDGGVYVQLGAYPEVEGSYLATTEGGAVVAGRWTHLRATFDGGALAIEVDGIERPWLPAGFEQIAEQDRPPPPSEVPFAGGERGELTISRPDRIFVGAIDEPKVNVALPPRVVVVPPGIEILGEAQEIRFDGRGSLDSQFHVSPVVLRLAEAVDAGPEEGTAPGPHTAVAASVPRAANAGEEGDDARNEQREVVDMLEALSRYVEENRERHGLGVEDIEPKESSRGRGAEREGERHTEEIIVDLSGMIRS